MNKQNSQNNSEHGFTIIEILVIIITICILSAIIVATHSGIARNQRNQQREQNIKTLYQQLEAYYVIHSQYPSLAEMDNLNWVKQNMKTLDINTLRDPSSKSYELVAKPQPDAYAYDVTATNGSTCNDTTIICAHYTLTATLEHSPQKTYSKSSLN